MSPPPTSVDDAAAAPLKEPHAHTSTSASHPSPPPPPNGPEASLAAGSSTGKKKKKKKASGAAPTPMDPYYARAMQRFPVTLRNSKAKGRHAAAAEELQEGTTVCLEQATAFVVRSEFLDQHCHVCLNALATKMMCQDCRKAFYCSQTCLERDDTHTLACSTMRQVDSIARATDVDVDMLRLITFLMARRQRDAENGVSEEQEQQDDDATRPLTATPFWCTADLISHREQADKAFIRVISEAAERLVPEWPESMHVPVDEIVTLACRINSNAHGLGDSEGRNTDVALGLFPVGAMFFNHACNPNCAFVGVRDGRLAIRTIRPVGRDEELTVSYIDLYAPRDERRQDLLATKHFWCKCKRCTTPIESSVDRYLHSVVCEACRQDVYVIPPCTLDDILSGHGGLAAVSEEAEWKCAKCSSKATARSVLATLQQAQQLYMEGMVALRKQRDYRRAQTKLKPLTKVASSVSGDLHPQNAVRLNASIPLMNCLRHSDDIAGAIDVNRFILETMEKHADHNLPRNTAEISDFYQNLGELCKVMADRCRDSGRRPLEKRYRKEAKDAFAHAAKVRSVVFGSDHPKTKLVRQQAATVVA